MNKHYLKVGDLLKVIKENNLPDDIAVCYHRIEDRYFKEYDWTTLKVKGDTYYKALRHNEEMRKGELVISGKLDSDEVGEYYWHDKYKKQRHFLDENDEDILDQYIEGFSAFYNKEKNILCITAHY